ncbi:MAG: DNA methyltransferase, partial [Methanosarcinales archaeon]
MISKINSQLSLITYSGIEERLEDIDWSFRGADTKYATHGLHQYPARMIPQIPHQLIPKFSKTGDLILDPFSGSGTVLAESILYGRYAIGVDINPLACLISKVKST